MTQDIYKNPFIENNFNSLIDVDITKINEDMASRRKQLTSKVREILEKYIAPDGWKTLNIKDNKNNKELHTIHNNRTVIYLEDIENLTEEIVKLKLKNGRK